MAYEYLNKCTDEMFESRHCVSGCSDMLFAYYNHVLCQPKFVSQRAYFQKRLFQWNSAMAYGYFRTIKKQLLYEARRMFDEYERNLVKKIEDDRNNI